MGKLSERSAADGSWGMGSKHFDVATKVRGTSFRARERAIRLELWLQQDRDRGSEYPYDGMTVAEC